MSIVYLTKKEAQRVMAAFHFRPTTLEGVFVCHRSVQFDPLKPVGSNHDLVFQSRVKGYKIDDWQKLAYTKRKIFDGWDKQACLIPIESWPSRRIFHDLHKPHFERIWKEFPQGVEEVLKELETRGPLEPNQLDFQERREDWRGSWYGPSVAKQILRALWNSGRVMTVNRAKGRHVYDLTERVLPPEILNHPKMTHVDMQRELVLERHRAVGFLRPGAATEVWSINKFPKAAVIADLVASGELVAVDIEGQRFHAVPAMLDLTTARVSREPKIIAPLDPIMWDRKGVNHIWGFEYLWEVYVPEAKRRWGYYVLPIMVGDQFVARADLFCRNGDLEVRAWHWEEGQKGDQNELLKEFCDYLEPKP